MPVIIKELVTEPVQTQEVSFATDTGTVRGRFIFRPRHPNAPGVVVLHGVHHSGIDEPRLEVLPWRWRAADSAC